MAAASSSATAAGAALDEVARSGLICGFSGVIEVSLPLPSMIWVWPWNATVLAPNPLARPEASSANFFLSTWLIAYITMNSTMSRVSMSA